MRVIITVLNCVQRVCLCHHKVYFVLKNLQIRVLVKSRSIDDFLGLKDGYSVFKHVIFLNKNIGSGQGSGHFFLEFIHFLYFALRNLKLVSGFGQLNDNIVLFLQQHLIIFDIVLLTCIFSFVADIPQHFKLPFELDDQTFHFMLIGETSFVSVSLITQNMLIFVHQVIVQLPVFVDFQSNDIVLIFVSLPHFAFLDEILLNSVDCCFQLDNMFFKTGNLSLVPRFSLLI
jgi:hypothetical protein